MAEVDTGSVVAVVVVAVVEDVVAVVVGPGEDVVWPLQVSRGGVKGPDTQLPHSASSEQEEKRKQSSVSQE